MLGGRSLPTLVGMGGLFRSSVLLTYLLILFVFYAVIAGAQDMENMLLVEGDECRLFRSCVDSGATVELTAISESASHTPEVRSVSCVTRCDSCGPM